MFVRISRRNGEDAKLHAGKPRGRRVGAPAELSLRPRVGIERSEKGRRFAYEGLLVEHGDSRIFQSPRRKPVAFGKASRKRSVVYRAAAARGAFRLQNRPSAAARPGRIEGASRPSRERLGHVAAAGVEDAPYAGRDLACGARARKAALLFRADRHDFAGRKGVGERAVVSGRGVLAAAAPHQACAYQHFHRNPSSSASCSRKPREIPAVLRALPP